MVEGQDDEQLELQRDLIAARRRAVAVLTEPAPDGIRLGEIGQELADVLARFHSDEELWASLRGGQANLASLDDKRRRELRLAIDVAWTPFLEARGYEPPPPVGDYANAFTRDLIWAVNEPEDVDLDHLRRRLADMARRLGAAVADDRPGHLVRVGAFVRHAAPVVARAAFVAGVAAAAGLVSGPVAALGVGAGLANLMGEAAKGAATASLDRFVPAVAEPSVHADAIAFDRAVARLTHWTSYDRCGQQRANIEFLQATPAGDANTSVLVEECLTWASGGLAAALLVAAAVTETRSGPLHDVDAMADTLSRLVDALVVREFDLAQHHLDSLTEQQIAVQEYQAHVVPDSTLEMFRREAAASEPRSLDRLAIDGIQRRVRQLERSEAEPPDPDTLVW